MLSSLRLRSLAQILVSATVICFATATFAQTQRAPRITMPVDNADLVRLPGNTHPLARAEFDRGTAPDATPATRMLLLLSRTPQQQSALDALVQDQQTPGSPNFHKWLTPAEFAQRFGPDASDLQQVTGWLQSQGFTVSRIGGGNMVVEFSGTAAMVRSAFHTQIHRYEVRGNRYWANASDPKVPAALAPVVSGVVQLNNFPRKPQSRIKGQFERQSDGTLKPLFTVSDGSGTRYYAVGPADFAKIYNTSPLLQAGNDGTGQSIAIIGVTNVHLQDVIDFRNMFGLGSGSTSVVIDGTDPGIVDGDETESLLDLEWSNAVAPGATITLYTAQNTETTSGLFLAATHVIDNNSAGIMSFSYGDCEANIGTTGNQFISTLFQQAAAQGITVIVSSGDNGAAGCDDQNSDSKASRGFGVNGLASTPYNVAVGGTDFNDAATQSQYWSNTNAQTTLASVLSYIPERTWNETCAARAAAGNLSVCTATSPDLQLWAGSGGPSNCAVSSGTTCVSGVPKPSWQTGTGVPSDGVRDIPDVSLFASSGSDSKSFYVLCESDASQYSYTPCPSTFFGIGGTSASAPSFAGIVALAAQKAGTRLGNINYQMYAIAAGTGASCASTSGTPAASCIFNDVTTGNISVPCTPGSPNCSATTGTVPGVLVTSGNLPGFTTTAGYDLATGLGSVNAANFATAIANAVHGFTPTTTALTLNGAATAITANHGDSISVGVNVSPASAGVVSVLGSKGGIDSNPLVAGAAAWNSKLFPGGTYDVKAHFPGDGSHAASDSNAVNVTINPEASKTLVNVVSFDYNTGQLTFNANNVPYGSPYILRVDVGDTAATVSSTQGISSKCATGTASCPGGSVTLTSNGSPLDGGTYALNSSGYTEDQAIQLPAGTFNLAAAYPGDSSYSASVGTNSVTITKATTSNVSAIQASGTLEYGRGVQFDVQIATTSSGLAPSGTVTVTDNGADQSANYQSFVYQALPGGPNGPALLHWSGFYYPSALGAHTLTTQYSGDTNYLGSTSSTVNFNVGPASTYVSTYGIIPNVATVNMPVKITITFTAGSRFGTPTGTVTFFDNGTAMNAPVTYNASTGTIVATINPTITQPGAHEITASYSGDTYFNAYQFDLGNLALYSQLPTTLQSVHSSIDPALTNHQVTLSTAVVIPNSNSLPAPTGTVTFSENGTPLAGTVAYSAQPTGYGSNTLAASLPYTFTTAGTHNITATYSGDSNYASSTANLSLTVVDKLPTVIQYLSVNGGNLASSSQPATVFAQVAFTNGINTAPLMGGTVTFLDNGTPLTEPVTYSPLAGYLNASLQHLFTSVGAHNITAQYSGDSTYAAATTSSPTAIQVLGPLAVTLPQGNVFTVSGGTYGVPVQVYNTTNAAMNVHMTCTPNTVSTSCAFQFPDPAVAAGGINDPGLTVTVPRPTGANRPFNPFGVSAVFAGVLAFAGFASRRRRIAVLTVLLCALVFAMASCGGGGGSSSSGGGVQKQKIYKFTITATSGSYTDSQVITLNVQ